eukprot:bmy_22337T0
MEPRMSSHLQSEVFLQKCHWPGRQSQVPPSGMPSPDGTHPGQGLYTCEAKLCQHQKRHIREKLSRKDKGRPSFVKNCTVHMTQRTFTCGEGGKDFPASTGPLQHRPPH